MKWVRIPDGFLFPSKSKFVIFKFYILDVALDCDSLHLLWWRRAANSWHQMTGGWKQWLQSISTDFFLIWSKDFQMYLILSQRCDFHPWHDTALRHPHVSALPACVGSFVVFSQGLCTEQTPDPSYKKGQKATLSWLSPGPADSPHVDLTL